MRRLGSLVRLAPEERALALRSHGWLLAARIALRVVPFTSLRRFIETRGVPDARRADDWPAAVRRGMIRATRSLPGSTCLAQALAAELLLRSGGHPARLTIGVATAKPTHNATAGAPAVPIDAHAWVESGGLVVAGEGELGQYTALVQFGNDS